MSTAFEKVWRFIKKSRVRRTRSDYKVRLRRSNRRKSKINPEQVDTRLNSRDVI